jgi:hypothetical protein
VNDVRVVLRPEARVGAFVARPFAPFVVASLARIDSLGDVRYLTADDLENVDEAFGSARAHAPAPAGTIVRAPCASGLLATTGWLASFEGRAGGRPIACAPDRDILRVSLDATPSGVRRFAEDAVRAFHGAERPVSPALYTVDDLGNVVPFVEGAGAALGHALLASSAYAEQKTRLDTTARAGAPFVAELLLVEHRDDGRALTVATWGASAPTLLPRADVIVLAGASWRFAVRWCVLEARVAARCWTLRNDLLPARIEATRWPSDSDLAALFDARDSLIEGVPPAG